MTPLQAELHQAHKARQARMAAAAERHAWNARARLDAIDALPAPVVEPVSLRESVKTETNERDWLLVGQRPVATIRDIQRIVAKHYGFTCMDMRSKRRTAALAHARHVAMFIAKSATPRSFPEIGRHFGGRDHTTVLHGVRKIGSMIETDESFRAEVDGLKAQFEVPS